MVTELERVLLKEEIYWRQKLRALWLKEGDKCTKFFHRIANYTSVVMPLRWLQSDNRVLSSPPEIHDHIVWFYETLLTKSVD